MRGGDGGDGNERGREDETPPFHAPLIHTPIYAPENGSLRLDADLRQLLAQEFLTFLLPRLRPNGLPVMSRNFFRLRITKVVFPRHVGPLGDADLQNTAKPRTGAFLCIARGLHVHSPGFSGTHCPYSRRDGWLGRVDLGSWLYIGMVYPTKDGYPRVPGVAQ